MSRRPGADEANAIATLCCATALILTLRRPDQVFQPAFWGESGPFTLASYAERGFASIVEPVQGYHVLISKIIELTAFGLSFTYAAYIAAWLTIGFTVLVILAIAFSPTQLRYPVFCAFAALLVPTDSEVFGASLFAFWWAGLLLVLAVLWRVDARPWLRMSYVIVGGLSSPLIVPAAAILVVRAITERTTRSAAIAATAGAAAIVQAVTAAMHLRRPETIPFDAATLTLAVEKFVGLYFTGAFVQEPGASAVLSFALLAIFAVLIWCVRRKLDRSFAMLVAMWVAACVLSVVRVPGMEFHPIVDGQRYFFYPFILLTWAAAWVAAVSPVPIRSVLAAAFVFAVANVVRFDPGPTAGFTRRHEPLDWRRHAEQCAVSDSYRMPFHTSGAGDGLWYVTLTGAQCSAMKNRAILHRLRLALGIGPAN